MSADRGRPWPGPTGIERQLALVIALLALAVLAPQCLGGGEPAPPPKPVETR